MHAGRNHNVLTRDPSEATDKFAQLHMGLEVSFAQYSSRLAWTIVAPCL